MVIKFIFKKITAVVLISLPLVTFAAFNNVVDSEIPNPLGDGTTISRVVANITDFILTAGIAVSVIVFLIAGFQYLFSFGSEQKVGQARKTMTYGAIGALVLLLGKGITQLIISIIG